MTSTFHGIETARRALFANQKALETTNHNIANANNEGYTRQKANMSATNPYTKPAMNSSTSAGQIGSGVEVDSIERMRDDFIDSQIHQETNKKGEWESRNDTLKRLESMYTEPSDSGLRSVFDQFWESLQDLSNNPAEQAARTQVMERGVSLADTVNHMYNQFTDLKEDLNREMEINVDSINSISEQIANLNEQIHNVEISSSQDANDLRDKRDMLLDELSEYTNFNVTEETQNGQEVFTVKIDGEELVSGNEFNELEFQEGEIEDNGDNDIDLSQQEPEKEGKVVWADEPDPDNEVNFNSGKMEGLQESQQTVQGHIDDLRSSIAQFQNAFNEIHGAEDAFNHHEATNDNGIDGIDDFFEWVNEDGELLRVKEDIQDDVFKINAGYLEDVDDEMFPGNGENARRLAGLKDANIINADVDSSNDFIDIEGNDDISELDGDTTYNDYIDAMVSDLGVKGQQAERMVENQELLVNELQNRREAVSGVSLDEEMTNMVQYQHTYNAASRMVTTIDESLDTIINQMGLVGR